MYTPNMEDLAKRPVPPPLPVYHPLTSERNEIRLCSIQPGEWDDQVACKLLIYSLDKTVEYRCLSYVWGDQNDRVPISLNGQAFSITRNLWLALRRLRWYGQLDYFWIDAICINQDDISEKTQQVRKMTEIFSRTREVIVWLGESDVLGRVAGYEQSSPSTSLRSVLRSIRRSRPESRESEPETCMNNEEPNAIGFVVALLNNFASGKHITKMGYMSSCSSCSGRGEHIHTTREWELAIRCIQRFSDLPWFARTWTLQEIVLPKTAGLVVGPYTFTWDHLTTAVGKLSCHWHGARLNREGGDTGCCNLHFRKLPGEHHHILQAFFNQVQEMELIRCLHHGNADIQLPSLLQQFRHRQATDPRDKVFGVLGMQRLSSSPPIEIVADYHMSTCQVYCALAVEALRAQGTLQFLQGDLTRTLDHLPSWTPDWSEQSRKEVDEGPGYAGVWRATYSHLYEAAQGFGTPFHFQYEKDTGELQLDGIVFDTVTEVTNTAGVSRDLNRLARYILQFMDLINVKYAGRKDYVTGGALDDAFYRLLTGDIHSSTLVFNPHSSQALRRATTADAHKTKALLQPVFSNVKFKTHWHCGDAVEYTLIYGIIAGRRLFISHRGFIGLGPSDVSVGDRVVVLNGGSTPFVIRRRPPHPNQSLEPKFSMVGACYVHGIMDGEAVHSGNPIEKITLV